MELFVGDVEINLGAWARFAVLFSSELLELRGKAMHRTREQLDNRSVDSGYTFQATAETPLTPRPETDVDWARVADVIGVFREWNVSAQLIEAFLDRHATTLVEVLANAPRRRIEAEGCVCWIQRGATQAEALAEVERQLWLLSPLDEPTSLRRAH